MKKLTLLPLLLFAFNIYSHDIIYQHLKSHKHGVANIAIKKNANELTIVAVYPAYDIVGFEYIPKKAKDKSKLRKSYKKMIKNPVISSANCKIEKTIVNSALFDEHANSDNSFLDGMLSKRDMIEKDKLPKHMDFKVTSRFLCDKESNNLTFNYFYLFPNIEVVNVKANSLKGKTIQTLSIDNNIISN